MSRLFVLVVYVLLSTAIVLAQGAAPPPASDTRAFSSPPAKNDEYVIGANDLLQIKFFELPELEREVRVSTDGTISLLLLGLVPQDDAWRSGKEFVGVWHATAEDARRRQEALCVVPYGRYRALAVSPLESGRLDPPDICLVYATPGQMILLINGLQWTGYRRFDWSVVGETACADPEGRALATGEPSLALPCYAERRYGGVTDEEMLMALPPRFLPVAIEGLEALSRNGLRYPIPPYGAALARELRVETREAGGRFRRAGLRVRRMRQARSGRGVLHVCCMLEARAADVGIGVRTQGARRRRGRRVPGASARPRDCGPPCRIQPTQMAVPPRLGTVPRARDARAENEKTLPTRSRGGSLCVECGWSVLLQARATVVDRVDEVVAAPARLHVRGTGLRLDLDVDLRRGRHHLVVGRLGRHDRIRPLEVLIGLVIEKMQFVPQVLKIKPPGTTVTWVNREKRSNHSILFEQENLPESDRLFPGETYQRAFDKPGTYPYRCGPHPEMLGVIEVAE